MPPSEGATRAESHVVRVPDGARAGDPLSVLASWGDKFMLNVPSGVKPNDLFVVELVQ